MCLRVLFNTPAYMLYANSLSTPRQVMKAVQLLGRHLRKHPALERPGGPHPALAARMGGGPRRFGGPPPPPHMHRSPPPPPPPPRYGGPPPPPYGECVCAAAAAAAAGLRECLLWRQSGGPERQIDSAACVILGCCCGCVRSRETSDTLLGPYYPFITCTPLHDACSCSFSPLLACM